MWRRPPGVGARPPVRTPLCVLGLWITPKSHGLHFPFRKGGKRAPRLDLSPVWGYSRHGPVCWSQDASDGHVLASPFPFAFFRRFVTFSHACFNSHQMQQSVEVCLLPEATWRGDSTGLSCPAQPPPGDSPAWAPASSSAVHISRGFQL